MCQLLVSVLYSYQPGLMLTASLGCRCIIKSILQMSQWAEVVPPEISRFTVGKGLGSSPCPSASTFLPWDVGDALRATSAAGHGFLPQKRRGGLVRVACGDLRSWQLLDKLEPEGHQGPQSARGFGFTWQGTQRACPSGAWDLFPQTEPASPSCA